MFAIRRDGDQFFLHQPSEGLIVPFLLRFATGKVTVAVPSVHELDREYVVYDDLDEALRHTDRAHHEKIRLLVKLSRECSSILSANPEAALLTVAALRNWFTDLIERVRHKEANEMFSIDDIEAEHFGSLTVLPAAARIQMRH